MTLDLTCRSCDGTGDEWRPVFATGRHHHEPCPTCDGTVRLDLHQVALDVARAHGTTIAADFTGLSPSVIVRLRKIHDGYDRGRGRPTRAEMAAMPPRLNCTCIRCLDHRAAEVRHATKVLGHLFLTGNPAALGDWTEQAACADHDPDLFFPHPTEDDKLDAAKAICRTCPVIAQCRAAGAREPYGVWGGQSEEDRTGAVRRRPGRPKQGHGTRACYAAGCRRDECIEAASTYRRTRARTA